MEIKVLLRPVVDGTYVTSKSNTISRMKEETFSIIKLAYAFPLTKIEAI
jgi:hypothetical protein